jgi:hypothetical protein
VHSTPDILGDLHVEMRLHLHPEISICPPMTSGDRAEARPYRAEPSHADTAAAM